MNTYRRIGPSISNAAGQLVPCAHLQRPSYSFSLSSCSSSFHVLKRLLKYMSIVVRANSSHTPSSSPSPSLSPSSFCPLSSDFCWIQLQTIPVFFSLPRSTYSYHVGKHPSLLDLAKKCLRIRPIQSEGKCKRLHSK